MNTPNEHNATESSFGLVSLSEPVMHFTGQMSPAPGHIFWLSKDDTNFIGRAAESLTIADNVEFLGFKSQAEVRDALQSTDVYVMSSFAGGVPVAMMVAMEPMADGLPVVSTRIAGIAELIDDGVSGYLVPPGDADSLAVRIAQLLSDPELRATFGKAGRENVRAEFDIDKEANWLCKVLTSTQVGEQVGIRPSREREEPSATVSDRDDSRSKTTSSAAPALTAGR